MYKSLRFYILLFSILLITSVFGQRDSTVIVADSISMDSTLFILPDSPYVITRAGEKIKYDYIFKSTSGRMVCKDSMGQRKRYPFDELISSVTGSVKDSVYKQLIFATPPGYGHSADRDLEGNLLNCTGVSEIYLMNSDAVMIKFSPNNRSGLNLATPPQQMFFDMALNGPVYLIMTSDEDILVSKMKSDLIDQLEQHFPNCKEVIEKIDQHELVKLSRIQRVYMKNEYVEIRSFF